MTDKIQHAQADLYSNIAEKASNIGESIKENIASADQSTTTGMRDATATAASKLNDAGSSAAEAAGGVADKAAVMYNRAKETVKVRALCCSHWASLALVFMHVLHDCDLRVGTAAVASGSAYECNQLQLPCTTACHATVSCVFSSETLCWPWEYELMLRDHSTLPLPVLLLLQGALGLGGGEGHTGGAAGYEGVVFGSDDPEYKSGGRATEGSGVTGESSVQGKCRGLCVWIEEALF